jgi:hypothetical protein
MQVRTKPLMGYPRLSGMKCRAHQRRFALSAPRLPCDLPSAAAILALTTAITPKVRLRVEDFCSVAVKFGEGLF